MSNQVVRAAVGIITAGILFTAPAQDLGGGCLVVGVIDRLGADMAAVEFVSGDWRAVVWSALPDGAREGDVLVHCEDGGYAIDRTETVRRRAETRACTNALRVTGE